MISVEDFLHQQSQKTVDQRESQEFQEIQKTQKSHVVQEMSDADDDMANDMADDTHQEDDASYSTTVMQARRYRAAQRAMRRNRAHSAFSVDHDETVDREDRLAAARIAAGEEISETMSSESRESTIPRRKRYRSLTGATRNRELDASKAQDETHCMQAALRLLDYAPRSCEDMRERLEDKGYTNSTIYQVIDRLKSMRFLDDSEYARTVVRRCLQKMMGERATAIELMRKAVSSSAISYVMWESVELGMFDYAAMQLGQKIARQTKNLDPLVRKRRFFAAGARKGHSYQTLQEVYDRVFANE